jgi:hypothetical protein
MIHDEKYSVDLEKFLLEIRRHLLRRRECSVCKTR